MDIALRFARDVVEIVDAIVGSTEVDPGSDVAIDVTLRRFGHADEIQRVRIPIPWSAAGDKIEIALEPGNLVKLDLPIANDLDQLFDNVRAGYPATSLIASTKLATRGVKLRGHIVSELPGSALDMLQPQGEAERPTSFPAQRRLEVPLGRVVIGNAKVKLEVREEPK